jgi:hypothetical protein
MSVVALQAVMAVLAVATFAAAVRLQTRTRIVRLAFPQDHEPGHHKASREPVLV